MNAPVDVDDDDDDVDLGLVEHCMCKFTVSAISSFVSGRLKMLQIDKKLRMSPWRHRK